MKEPIQAIITVLALVNPVMCMAIFADCVKDIPRGEKEKIAFKAIAAIGVVLLVAAIAGTTILGAFGISLNAFSCAGGGILVWIGAGMLKSTQQTSNTVSPQSMGSNISLAPLILFAASPGTITGVITIAAAHKKHILPLTAIIGVVATLVILAVALLISTRMTGTLRKVGLVKEMITSYMGVIVIAMGVQFTLTGIRGFFS
ncbi:MAG: MarC family protein [Gammaproteobacteria bacterium]|nr:MarC family protein [Gammaproteobacteria bacterium]MCP5425581.1 MarC family protein [Gammaproteobacteria bacterium]MCP5459019.1 MarC family protein [Gammaproteobacteria bacterium]